VVSEVMHSELYHHTLQPVSIAVWFHPESSDPSWVHAAESGLVQPFFVEPTCPPKCTCGEGQEDRLGDAPIRFFLDQTLNALREKRYWGCQFYIQRAPNEPKLKPPDPKPLHKTT